MADSVSKTTKMAKEAMLSALLLTHNYIDTLW